MLRAENINIYLKKFKFHDSTAHRSNVFVTNEDVFCKIPDSSTILNLIKSGGGKKYLTLDK